MTERGCQAREMGQVWCIQVILYGSVRAGGERHSAMTYGCWHVCDVDDSC